MMGPTTGGLADADPAALASRRGFEPLLVP